MSRPDTTPPPPEPPDGVAHISGPLTDAMDRIAGRREAAGIEPLIQFSDWPRILACSRRTVERLKSAEKLPPPDLIVGKRSPRWKPETVKRWIDAQARKGVAR